MIARENRRRSWSEQVAARRTAWDSVPAWILGVALLLLLMGDVKLGSLAIAACVYLFARCWLRPRWWIVRYLVFAAMFTVVCWVCPLAIWTQHTGHLGVRVLPIMWGLPSREGFERARRREFVLGGCVIIYPFPSRWVVQVSVP